MKREVKVHFEVYCGQLKHLKGYAAHCLATGNDWKAEALPDLLEMIVKHFAALSKPEVYWVDVSVVPFPDLRKPQDVV